MGFKTSASLLALASGLVAVAQPIAAQTVSQPGGGDTTTTQSDTGTDAVVESATAPR